MVLTPEGVGIDNDCAAEGQQQLYMTDPSSRQRMPLTSTSSQLPDSNKNLVLGPRRGLTQRLAD
jgi:hypothetical protein